MRIKTCVAFALVGTTAFLFAPRPGRSQTGPSSWGGRRWGRRGDGGGWSSDPNDLFNRLSGGKDFAVRTQITDPSLLHFYDRVAQRTGNTTGQITRQQFVAYMRQRAAQAAGGAAPADPRNGADRTDRRAENSFRRLDVNGDGLLNYDEMPDALRSERDQWDTNKDGFINLEEYKNYFRARAQQREAQRGSPSSGGPILIAPPPVEEPQKPPVVYRAGKLPKELPAWFAQYDTDKDGQIGLYEWRAAKRPLAEFMAMDRNQDGFLTIDEVLRYEKHKQEQLAKAQHDGRQAPNPAPAAQRNRYSSRGR
jgi:Ca2+-binding EF-hand superfamily protein